MPKTIRFAGENAKKTLVRMSDGARSQAWPYREILSAAVPGDAISRREGGRWRLTRSIGGRSGFDLRLWSDKHLETRGADRAGVSWWTSLDTILPSKSSWLRSAQVHWLFEDVR
jgi:hypothetical protein